MDERSLKRRSWIKNVIIIFLIIMLILTFFSNTIMNWSLPTVSAQYAYGNTITTKVRASGTVKSNYSYEVMLDESRTIAEVLVRSGQKVEAGEVIFRLEDKESAELAAALDELDRIKDEYTDLLLSYEEAGISDEYENKTLKENIEKLRSELSAAQSEKENIIKYAKEYEDAKSTSKAAKKAKEAIEKEIAEINEKILKYQGGITTEVDDDQTVSAQLSAAKQELTAAQNALAQAENALVAAKNTVTIYKAQLDNSEIVRDNALDYYNSLKNSSSGTTQSELTSMYHAIEDSLRSLKYAYGTGYDEYAAAYMAYLDNKDTLAMDEAFNTYLGNYTENTDREPLEGALVNLRRQADTYIAALASYNSSAGLEQAIRSAEYAYNNAEAAYQSASQNYEQISQSVTDYEAAVSECKSSVEKADAKIKSFENALGADELIIQLEAKEEELEAAQEVYNDALEAENEAAEKASMTESDADKNISSIQSQLNDALDTYEQKLRFAEIEDEKESKAVSDKQEQISDQEAVVEKLRAKSVNAEVTAKISGTIVNVNCVAGEDVTAGNALASIEVQDKGYTAEISVTNAESSRISVGDAATVSNWWYSELTATVVSIRTDPSNPNTNKIVTLNVNGEVTPGQSLDFVIGERGQYYDTVVPKSAVREDNNGKFILVLNSKSTPLGNRYYAQRVDVQEIVSDDTNMAVSGLAGGEFVIRTATVPISDGQQVRLDEN